MTKRTKPTRKKSSASQLPLDAMLHDAFVLHQRGALSEARSRYSEILRREPKHFNALHLSGVIAIQANDYEKAIALINDALAINSGYAMAHGNLGLALARSGRIDAATASYERAIALDPNFADAYVGHGDQMMKLQRFEDALASYDRAVALSPMRAETWNSRGVALLELRRHDEARQSCNQAIAAQPDHAEAYNNRGSAHTKLGRYDQAFEDFAHALALRPDYPEAYSNRANARSKLGCYDEALEDYGHALALKPGYAEAYTNRGNAFTSLGRYDEALEDYDRALALNPDYAEAHFGKANAFLVLGRLEAGWPGYEWRWHERIRVDQPRDYAAPRWRGGEPIEGKTILLYNEQGFGDTIQFCRYAGRVSELGAKVLLEVQAPLASLMGSLSGVSQVIARGDALPHFDCHCPLLSLPLLFKTTLASIPGARSYLGCDPAKLEKFQARLGPKRAPRIGLAWSGNALHANDRNRSIPLTEFLRCLPEGRQYVCLQKELEPADAAALAAHPEILRLDEQIDDFGDTAALCELMDVVISVDTSLAHLAGALGKDTRILLPFSPDWRWLLERTDSPWYPSAKLYRQTAIGRWAEPLDRLKHEVP